MLQLLFAGDDKTVAHTCIREIAIWVSVAVAILVGTVIVIAVILYFRKKKWLLRNNQPSGKFLDCIL